MLDVTHKQIKKWSLFKFSFVLFLPFGLLLMFYTQFIAGTSFGPTELLLFSMSSLFFATILAGFMTFSSWIIGLIRPGAVALKVDQNTSKLNDIFE